MSEIAKFVITTFAALVGSGIGTTILGAMLKRKFDIQLEREKNRFTIGATSHMAAVAFDKHVCFCEAYANSVNSALDTLFESGPHEDVLANAGALLKVRREWTLWVESCVYARHLHEYFQHPLHLER